MASPIYCCDFNPNGNYNDDDDYDDHDNDDDNDDDDDNQREIFFGKCSVSWSGLWLDLPLGHPNQPIGTNFDIWANPIFGPETPKNGQI